MLIRYCCRRCLQQKIIRCRDCCVVVSDCTRRRKIIIVERTHREISGICAVITFRRLIRNPYGTWTRKKNMKWKKSYCGKLEFSFIVTTNKGLKLIFHRNSSWLEVLSLSRCSSWMVFYRSRDSRNQSLFHFKSLRNLWTFCGKLFIPSSNLWERRGLLLIQLGETNILELFSGSAKICFVDYEGIWEIRVAQIY